MENAGKEQEKLTKLLNAEGDRYIKLQQESQQKLHAEAENLKLKDN